MSGEKQTGTVDLFIISLRRAVERRATMVEELERAGLAARFFDAVDASELGRDELVKRCVPYGPWGMLRLHDMACTLSHIDALRQFLSGSAAYCLMMEDDVFVSIDLSAWLEDMSWWPADADVVKMERWRKDSMRIITGPVMASHRGREIRRLHSRYMGAAGYIVNRKAAHEIVAHSPVDLPIDHLIFNMNASRLSKRLVIYQVNPALIKQGNEPKPTQHRPDATVRETREQGMQYVRREIRRGLYEVNRLHSQIGCILFGGGALIKPTWKSSC
jgi:glycosyl transferase family 25